MLLDEGEGEGEGEGDECGTSLSWLRCDPQSELHKPWPLIACCRCSQFHLFGGPARWAVS